MITLRRIRRVVRHTISRRRHAIRHGYRSGLEEKISRQIEEAGLVVLYETDKISYLVPERKSVYTPDFKLPKPNGEFFFVETKGIFSVQDRTKHLLIRHQHPHIDIRFVFSNQNQKIYKGSPTSYGDWCAKHGFQYANRTIPDHWLEEGESVDELDTTETK